MTKKEAATLKAGRPGDKVWVKGTVRTASDGKFVEIQFAGYSIDIPHNDIVRRGRTIKRKFEPNIPTGVAPRRGL